MNSIVIDANIALALALPLPYSSRVNQCWLEWQQNLVSIAVPALWHYEVLSGLRKAVVKQILTEEQAWKTILAFRELAIDVYPSTVELDRLALHWAERINQPVVYDASYLALADHLKANFWTADQRLANTTRQLGIDWVHAV